VHCKCDVSTSCKFSAPLSKKDFTPLLAIKANLNGENGSGQYRLVTLTQEKSSAKLEIALCNEVQRSRRIDRAEINAQANNQNWSFAFKVQYAAKNSVVSNISENRCHTLRESSSE
jgi:hypothetical protein